MFAMYSTDTRMLITHDRTAYISAIPCVHRTAGTDLRLTPLWRSKAMGALGKHLINCLSQRWMIRTMVTVVHRDKLLKGRCRRRFDLTRRGVCTYRGRALSATKNLFLLSAGEVAR
jgi:hypothetical protein